MIPDYLKNPSLQSRLGAFSGRTVFFFPTPGNAGDALIQAATYNLFNRLDIRFNIMGSDLDVSGQSVIIGGGGNFVPTYNAVKRVIQRVHRQAAELILLPHTIRGNEDLIQELGPNVELYCRDVETYSHVLRHRSRARAELAHDMSFMVDVPALASMAEERAAALIAERIKSTTLENLLAETGVRFFFATNDAKQALRLTPRSNTDPALILKTSVLPGEAEVGALALIRYIERAVEVHTNRTQVGIAAASIGKRVYLYNNAYDQVEGIYRHSLHADFPNSQFIP